MRKLLHSIRFGYLFSLILFCFPSVNVLLGQADTTIVQTFTFSDIYKRQDTYLFPPAQSWSKILMYYTLKCDPLTPWDQYNCGEWDYLTYTVVHDSTGIIDSSLLSHTNFELIGNENITPDSLPYTSVPTYDTYLNSYYNLVVDNVLSENIYPVGTAIQTSTITLPSSAINGRSQYLWQASELTAAGVTAGDISAIEFKVTNNPYAFEHLTLKMKETTLSAVTDFDNTGFTTVFENMISLSTSLNRIQFATPFNWDGTSNLLVEFSFDND
ncbi:MAG: hypothetical protein K1X92_18975, partial [Bacteroidia bacterium]|nr:hypothetical protein [Bacteroidia bacterium]